MFNIFAWMIIIGAIYGFVLFAFNAFYAVIKLKDFIKGRRNKNGR